MLNIILTILLVMALFTLGWRKTMKVIVNFYQSESIEYDLEKTDISYDDKFVYIAINDNEGFAFPKDDVENIEIE